MKDVDVSEWITQVDQTFQRICFYSMVENSGTGNKGFTFRKKK